MIVRNLTRSGRIRELAAVGLLTLVAAPAAAQVPRILFDRVSLEEGLSQSAVNSILQDRYGFLWFATQEGLNRYDGYSFVLVRHDPEDPDSLPQSVPLVMREDAGGYFWIGFEGGGLSRFDPATRKAIKYRNDPTNPASLSGDTVKDILLAADGSIWIATHAGLNRLDPDRGTFRRFNNNPADPSSLSADRVEALLDTGDGDLWVGTAGGLDRLDVASGSIVHLETGSSALSGLASAGINSLFSDATGTLWIGTGRNGLYRLDPRSGEGRHYQHDPDRSDSLSSNSVEAIEQDVQGTIWIGTAGGLSRYRPETDSFWVYHHDPADESSLHYDNIQTLFQDRGGVLWVGHKVRGLSKWNVSTGFFPHFKQESDNPRSLTNNVVSAFCEDPSGAIWIGTFGGGLDLFDLEQGLLREYHKDPTDPSSLTDDRVMSLLVDRDETLWVGTLRGGLLRKAKRERGFVLYPHDPSDASTLGQIGVTSILQDGAGVLWVGTFRGGLDRFDPATDSFVHYRNQPGNPTTLSNDTVTSIAAGEDGVLWVGTEGGLNRFDPLSGTFTRFANDPANPQSLSSDAVLSLHLDRRGDLWIGTLGGGVNRWRLEARQAHRGIFTRFTTEQGLANNYVHGILEDDEGNLWMSTNRGLSRFDLETETFRNYDTRQGLQSEEFNHGAAYRTSKGVLLFGGINGFNAFLPERIHPNIHVPPVVITAIRKLNEDMDLGLPPFMVDEIELTYRDYVVSFEFAALDFTAPEKNRYAYRLEGFENDWVELGNLRRATYTNLAPGRYTLHVRGSNNDGVWNDGGASIRLRVIPPPWKTWWAYSLYFLAMVAIVASYTRAQARKLEQEAEYSRKLEREVAARTAELARRNEQLEQANRNLEEASLTDSLTGLRNRRFVVTNIEEEIALAERRHEADRRSGIDDRGQKLDFLFLMFDLDGLKQINDNHGHATGDRLLLGIRDLLERICRKSDTVVRWGGDEFLIVGRDANPDAAELLAERVRKAVAEHPFDLGLEKPVFLSCSLGYAFHPFQADHPEALNWEQVLAVADRALYAAKKSGRNAWVGILGTEKTPPDDFFQRVFEAPDQLAAEGFIRIRTSFEDLAALVWDM